MDQAWPYIISSVFAIAGAAIFWYGFNRMHKYRLIKDIPRSKIRSMAMGLVEVHGTVYCEKPLKTPFSGSDCVYYKYEIQEYRRHISRDSKGRTKTTYRWEAVAGGQRNIPFFARDETGEVYVSPAEAEFNVDMKKAFLQKAGIFGGFTALINALKDWDKNDEEFFDSSELNLIPIKANKGFSFSFGNRVGDRRYFEYYLEPDENLFVIGTAVNDGIAPNSILIRKGENQPTFIISNKSEKELLKSLKRKMIASYIFGGILFVGGVLLFSHFAGVF